MQTLLNSLVRLRWIPVVALAAAAAVFVWQYMELDEVSSAEIETAAELQVPEPVKIDDRAWQVFKPSPGLRTPAPAPSGEQQNYRLAGTFLTYADMSSDSEEAGSRIAIVDNLKKGSQFMAREGETVEEATLVKVLDDRAELEVNGQRFELFLSYTGAFAGNTEEATETDEGVQKFSDAAVISSSRFGNQIDTNRWILSRTALTDYYTEMLEDPERLAKLYMTFAPDYKEKDIEGYTLDIQGEKDFLNMMGLQQGDTVRKVNSMRMTSQRRAEFFIAEFARKNLDTVVFDVERAGKKQKLIYLLR